MKYTVRVSGEVSIEAENVAQAARIAKGIHLFGADRVGGRRPGPHDRDSIRHVVSVARFERSAPMKSTPGVNEGSAS